MEVLEFFSPVLNIEGLGIEYLPIWTLVVLAGIALYIVWHLLQTFVRIVVATAVAIVILYFSVPGFLGRAFSFLGF